MKRPIVFWGLIALAGFFLASIVIYIIGPSKPAGADLSTSYNGVEIVPDLRKDTIPALTNPAYESGNSSLTWIKKEDKVIGINFNGDIRAYPLKIMSWHEIVNDTVGGKNVLVTYVPLCGSGVVFSRDINGKTLDFGNTGALYESCSVMYDTNSNSYWWQVSGKSIRGPEIESQLEVLPSVVTTWGEWYETYPNTQLLSVNTGHNRDYLIDPYADYYKLENSAFPVSVNDDRLKGKQRIVGISVNGKHKAYTVENANSSPISDVVEGQNIEVIGSKNGETAQILFVNGEQKDIAPQTNAFWFAWSTAHPETELYQN